jgi:predicted DNA-binding transcriptional regulator AlpA
MSDEDLIDVNELARMFGNVSKATVWRGVRDGRFPKPIKLGPYISRWLRREARQHLDKLMTERAGDPPQI